MVDESPLGGKVLERRNAFSWNLNMWEEWRKHAVAALAIVAKDPDDEVRDQAAAAIANMGQALDLAAALEVIGDRGRPAPISTVFALGPLKSKVLAEAVFDAYCRSNDLKTAFAQCNGYPMFDADGGVRVLVEALEGEDQQRSRIAAEFLADIGPPQAEAALVRALARRPRGCSDIFRALGKIGTPTAADTLIGYLSHDDPMVRVRAIEALSDCGDRRAIPHLFALAGDADADVRRSAGGVLERLRASDAGPLREYAPATDPAADLETVDELVETFERALEESGSLRSAMDEATDAVYLLGAHSDPRAVPALIDAYGAVSDLMESRGFELELGDPDEQEAAASRIYETEQLCDLIVGALGDGRDPRAIDLLAGVAGGCRESSASVRAVALLDDFQGPGVFDRLKAIQSRFRDEGWKLGVGVTLARRGDRESIEAMLAALRSRDVDDLQRAAWTLGQVFRDEPLLDDAAPLGPLRTALPRRRRMNKSERERKAWYDAYTKRNSGPLSFAPPEEFVSRAQAHLDEHGTPLLEYRLPGYTHKLEVRVRGGGRYEFDAPSMYDPDDEPNTMDCAARVLRGHGTETRFVHPDTGRELGKLTFRNNDGMLSYGLSAAGVDTLLAISCLQYFLDEEKQGVRIEAR